MSFLDDLDAVDPNTIESNGPSYPMAQWLHGDPKMAAVGGVTHTGGIILPSKYVSDDIAPPPGWTRTNVAFGSGKTEQVLASQKTRLAVIRTRFRWFVTHGGVTTYYPRSGYVADSGMRGHVQALCAVHGYDFPVVVTFKGKASQEFERLLKDFSQKIQEAAHRLLVSKSTSGTRFPRFAFWMRLAPSPHIKVGQKGQESIVTPPVLELPNALTEDYLGKVYVGRENLLAFQQYYHDAAEWGLAWDRAGLEEEIPSEFGEIGAEVVDSESTQPAKTVAQKPETTTLAEDQMDFLGRVVKKTDKLLDAAMKPEVKNWITTHIVGAFEAKRHYLNHIDDHFNVQSAINLTYEQIWALFEHKHKGKEYPPQWRGKEKKKPKVKAPPTGTSPLAIRIDELGVGSFYAYLQTETGLGNIDTDEKAARIVSELCDSIEKGVYNIGVEKDEQEMLETVKSLWK